MPKLIRRSENTTGGVRLVRTGETPRAFTTEAPRAQTDTPARQQVTPDTERADEWDKRNTPSASRQHLTALETERADERDKQNTPSASRKPNVLKRIGQGVSSGLAGLGGALSGFAGVVADNQGGTAMRGVYQGQVEALDRQIEALQATLSDPTMTARDIAETQEALRIARSQRANYANAVRANEKTAQGVYETVDAANRYAQRQAEQSVAGTSGVGRAALSLIPTATEIAAEAVPIVGTAVRAAATAGRRATENRYNSGADYNPQEAARSAMIAGTGVAVGSAASRAVNNAALKLLRTKGLQNYVLPNILSGGASATGYALGETGMNELARAVSEKDYTPDWSRIGQTALTAFAFGAVTRAINVAAISSQNKRYMNEQIDGVKTVYQRMKEAIDNPLMSDAERAALATQVMDATDRLLYSLDELQVVGAQREVDAAREFLTSIYGEMLPYTMQSAGGIPSAVTGVPAVSRSASLAPVLSASQPQAPQTPAQPAATAAGMAAANATKPLLQRPVPSTPTEAQTTAPPAAVSLPVEAARAEAQQTGENDVTEARARLLAEFAKTLGRNGERALTQFFTGGDPAEYAKGMTAVYNAGKHSAGMESVQTASAAALSDTQREAAYLAGQGDAALEARAAAAPNALATDAQHAPAAVENASVPSTSNPAPLRTGSLSATMTTEGYTPSVDTFEKRQAIQQAANTVRSRLSAGEVCAVNGYEYSVSEITPNSYAGTIRRTGDDLMGGAIRNGRDMLFRQTFRTRQDAIEALIGVAQNNRLLEVRENGYGITPEEKSAILAYKSSESYKINAKLYGDVTLDAWEEKLCKSLDSVLDKLPAHAGTVYRNLSFDDFGENTYNEFLAGFKIGVPVAFDSYTSTSKSVDGYPIKGEFVIKMEIDGINGRELDGFGNNFEQEVLFKRGTYFLPTEITTGADGHPLIKLTEVRGDGQRLGQSDSGGLGRDRGGDQAVREGLPAKGQKGHPGRSDEEGDRPHHGGSGAQKARGGQNGTGEQERSAGGSGRQRGAGQRAQGALGEIPDQGRILEAPGRRTEDGGVLDGVDAAPLQADREGAKPRGVLSGAGTDVSGHDGPHDTKGTGTGRSVGGHQGDDLPSAGEVSGEGLPEDTQRQIAQKSDEATQEPARGNNYVIPSAGLKLPNGEHARAKANIEAIKTVKMLMAENRFVTAAEQEILSRFVGWGGLQNALDERKADWAKEYKQLKTLLTDDEFRAAKASTMNAHYTSVEVIRAIYAGLESIGFRGGRLLEPSCGVGNFVGAMPPELAANSRWTMVELDPITGNIAKYLYPNASVRVQGFEDAKIPDRYMDAAISNVPFGNYGIADKSYPKAVTGAIHNYFFAKTLDKVRPGGVIAFITSRYTMDAADSKVRSYIMQRADLLGAIRLPDTAFQSNAGTSVVTDILLLKKRAEGTKYTGESFLNTGLHHQDIHVWEQTNDYFATHPEMVLGEASKTGSMYGSGSLTYKPKEIRLSLGKQIERAFKRISGRMDYPEKRTQEEIRAEIKRDAAKGKPGSLQVRNGKLYQNDGEAAVELEAPNGDVKRIAGMTAIRDIARELLSAQLDGKGAQEIKLLRDELNRQYDSFVKENGVLNAPKNKKLFAADPDRYFLLSLERYDSDRKKATKADIFTRNTVTPNVTVTHTDNIGEAVAVSMNENGRIDLGRIAQLTGETRDSVARSLLDSGLAFKNREGAFELAELYLSGNVKAKLRDAEALAEGDADYRRNVEALKKIIPADIPAEEISARPGVTWIPNNVYADFAAEMLGGRNSIYAQDVVVSHNPLVGQYDVQIKDKRLKDRPENTSTWGTPDKSFVKILTAIMNNKRLSVWRRTEDGKRFLDKTATAAVQEKQEKIISEFQKWLWQDEARKTTLVRLYNDVFNNTVTPKYDGSALTVDGAVAEKPLREHQRNAVYRAVVSGKPLLLAHRVGAGKTYEMAATAIKLRQLGIIKKPVFVVPKSIVAQWGKEFLEFFPAAKTMVLRETDFNAKNRKIFANRIATGDYDAVIMSYEQFKAVPMSYENQEKFYREQVDALEMAILETAAQLGRRDPSIKQLEKSKKSLEVKLKRLADMKKDEDNISFEEMGIDSLFVDEAHNFKNLFYTTNMSNVSGLGNKEGSQKAFDLYMKVRYLQDMNGGRGIVFATATPVMNSMSEMYIMQKYLQGDELEARELNSFDAWANQFGEVRTVLEMNPSGKGYRQKQSFSRFKNLAELQQMFRSFTDVVTEIPGLEIPSMRGGKRIVVESEPGEFQLRYIDQLAERADAIKNGSVDPSEDNMLKITSEGRKLSYTQRMIDPSLPYEDGCKIKKCVQNVFDEWKASGEIKGTQLIFCDLSTPKGGAVAETTDAETQPVEPLTTEDISIYDDMRNMLIAQGIPASEIAFIHDADTNEKKAALFEDMNHGKVRILIGSTGKMGVGMNAQERMVAIHHLDAPWRPGDIEQREGRGLRQGNINDEVAVFVYVTKSTFDSRMWDNLQRKASFIHQIMDGDLTARESEGDGDFALSAAEIKAISSGNPLIIEQFEVAAELQKLESLERAHNKEVSEARSRISKTKQMIAADEQTLSNLRKDKDRVRDTSGDKFTIRINSKTVTDRKTAGEALIAEGKRLLNMKREGEKLTMLGTFAGFDLYITDGAELLLRGSGQYRTQINLQSPSGTIQSLEAVPRRLGALLTATETRLEESKKAVARLEQTAAAPFERADELSKIRKRNAEIMEELNPAEDTAGYGEEDEDLSLESFSTADFKETDSSYSKSNEVSHPDQWKAERVRGGGDTSTARLSEIIQRIRHDFGVNVTTGHIRGAGVRGRYNRSNRGIRTRIANDLPTAAHELGHHMDNLYGLSTDAPDAAIRELVDNLDPNFAAQYKKEKLPGEGLAEYFRRFLQNSETAAIDYPAFTQYFKSTLSGKDLALVEALADEVNAYFALDADTATSSIRRKEEANRDLRTFGERIKDASASWYQHWVDRNHAIDEFAREMGDANTYRLATNAAYSHAMAGAIITGDLYDANGAYVGNGLKTALSGVNLKNTKEYDRFGEYLVVKHGVERLAEGMRVFADDRKNNSAWMQKRQTELEAEYPAFKEASERLYAFRHALYKAWGVDTGLISQATLDAWEERWDFYMPLNRAIDTYARSTGAKRGFANQTSTVRRAHGSGLDIIHPVDNLIDNIVLLVNAGTRNNVMRSLTDAAANDGNAVWMEKVPMPVQKKTFDMSGVKAQLSDSIQESDMTAADKAKMDEVIANISDVLEQYGRGKAYGNVVTVLKNGKPEYWKINDPLLLESLVQFDMGKRSKIVESYRAISRFMTACITGNDVLWSIFSNFPRDLQTLLAYSPNKGHPLAIFREIGAAYVNRFRSYGKMDPLYKEFLAMGGGQTSVYTADKNLAKRAREKFYGSKTAWLNPLEWLSVISETVESGPRYATYKLCRVKGMTPQEAIYAAHDVTVNFLRSGTYGRDVNGFVLYFNAAVQGADKFNRYFTADDAPAKDRAKIAAGRIVGYLASMAILGTLMYALNNRDEEAEENYRQLSNYTKNSFWLFPLGDGKYFAIPKARELSVPASFFETLAEYFHGENKRAFDGFWSYTAGSYAPPVVSDVLAVPDDGENALWGAVSSLGLAGVLGSSMANRDFLGRPIESAGMQYLEPRDRYNQRTSLLAKLMVDGVHELSGGRVKLSPQMLDYFFQQTLGGFWKAQKALFPVGHENRDLTLGIQGRFLKDNQYSTDLVNWLYDKATASSQAAKSHPGDMDRKITSAMDDRMTDFYGAYNKLSKNDTVADRGTRQVVLNMIKEYQKNDDLGTVSGVQQLVYGTVKADGQTDLLPSTMKSTVKDGTGMEHTLSGVQYVEFQADYNRLYWAYAEQLLPRAKSGSERIVTLRNVKALALEQAKNRTLGRIGAPKLDDAKFKGVSAEAIVRFKTATSKELADTDGSGSVNRQEFIAAIRALGLDRQTSSVLYRTKYSDESDPWR